jgi:hypothetical protein
VRYARVGGGNATPRRDITDAAKCNACHVDPGFHGGEARKGPDYCAMCHNSRNVNDERTSQFEAPFEKTPGTVQLSVMIHKIHKGSELIPGGSLPNPRPLYTLGLSRDFRAADGRAEGEADLAEFGHAFPGDLKDCQTCHKPGGYGLPEPSVLPTRVVTFKCKEAPDADGNAVCGNLSGSGGVTAPDTAAGDPGALRQLSRQRRRGRAHLDQHLRRDRVVRRLPRRRPLHGPHRDPPAEAMTP